MAGKQSKGGRPKHKPIYETGARAQENFVAGMKALLSPEKGNGKRHEHGKGR